MLSVWWMEGSGCWRRRSDSSWRVYSRVRHSPEAGVRGRRMFLSQGIPCINLVGLVVIMATLSRTAVGSSGPVVTS